MNNYEYIIASLPVITLNTRESSLPNADELIEQIRAQLSGRDQVEYDYFLSAYKEENLNADFYKKALASGNNFIAGWFSYDLDVRNTKVKYLNKSLGREESLDVLCLTEEERDFEEADTVNAVLNQKDTLDREKGLDKLMWNRADDLTIFSNFSLDTILAFTAKLKIMDRWAKLDPKTGEEMFHKLVEDLQSTYENKKQDII